MLRFPTFPQAFVRRTIDVSLAVLGLALLSPLLLLVMIAIVIESGFPVFFAQTRVGRDGRTFRMYKFRKFPATCDGGCPLTMKQDDRMTRVGRVMERTKLDEMPQLFNIIRGDMAIVGPRPESMAFADCFTESMQPLLRHRPGIFGPSQVAFRNECDLYPAGQNPVWFYRRTLFPAKTALDLDYYAGRTVWSDLMWIWRGILAVFGKVPDHDLPAARPIGSRQMDFLIPGE
ncbi:sugar transferase [Puniceibacterium confluentis]|uniref:sugar transferase n=1 Tax=Puniceibacterium confluentis TaxID=1958944 RepID=UPI0011B785C4|nr:sugar transferase [Puniceibacterium confluentis]